MTYTRAQVIQALVQLRRRQIWSIRGAAGAETRKVRRAFDVIAASSSKQVAKLERALRESKSDSFESD